MVAPHCGVSQREVVDALQRMGIKASDLDPPRYSRPNIVSREAGATGGRSVTERSLSSPMPVGMNMANDGLAGNGVRGLPNRPSSYQVGLLSKASCLIDDNESDEWLENA